MNILLSATWYPMCIALYYKLALEARDDVEVTTFGPTSGPRIPWGPQFYFPEHAVVPDIQTPVAAGSHMDRWCSTLDQFDLILQVDAAYHMLPPKEVPNALIATDPHCINYGKQRVFADWFFNMQKAYLREGDFLLPYAYCPRTHYPEPDIEPEYDVVINGLPYPPRRAMAEMLRSRGWAVKQGMGAIWDEYRIETALARVVFTHSSQDDLIARVFETMAMKKPLVTNYTSALTTYFMPPLDCMAYEPNDLDTALKQIESLLNNPEVAAAMAQDGRNAVNGHTYDARVKELLEVIGAI
jgi:hypothetical protein